MAQVPEKINYQGFLANTSGAAVPDGTYAVTFSIYDAASTVVWTELHSSIQVTGGIFNVHLGLPMNPFPDFDGEMYLGIRVGTDPEMAPRQLLTSVPFALKAGEAETLDGHPASDFALSTHTQAFSTLTGAASDAQIPNTITINKATSADTATSAQKAETADYATEAGHAVTADNATTATTAATATNATNATNAGNADTLDTYHAAAFSLASHSHYFLNASDGSPSQALYLDATGEVGIGNTAPARKLDVTGTARVMDDQSTVDMNRYYNSGLIITSKKYGVEGKVTSSYGNNYGLYGSAENGAFNNYGVFGTSSTSGAYGVYGNVTNTEDNISYGGFFTSSSQRGIGVKGLASYSGNVSTATSYGGYFESDSSRGTGVYARVNYSGAGLKYAGYFECDSETGYGVYSKVNGSYTNWTFRGEATGTGSSGGWFSTTGEDTTAVYGNATGTTGTSNYNIGGDFRAAGNHGYGVKAVASGQYGIGIYADGGSDGLAAHFRGNVKIARASDGATVMELGEGLDYAEGFRVKEPKLIEPGTVLVIDPETPGGLCISKDAYDTKVAGIVAGANGLGSGVRLGAGRFDHDVALAGRVYCMVDATENGIRLGDLLTTSSIPGHAMKAADRERSYGTILGKAMEPMEKGQKGKILVLVTLQ